MDCHFYINDDRLYTPRDRIVSGTLTLSSTSETKDIKSITYGIKSQVQLLPHYDSHGNITNPIVYNYHYYNKNEYRRMNERYRRFMINDPNMKDLFIVNVGMVNESIQNEKLIKSPDGNWLFPKNETIVTNFQLEFPSPDEWFLPSTADFGFNTSRIYHYTVQIRYFVYVKVDRVSSFLKKVKSDDFYQTIEYQSGAQFPTQLLFLSYKEIKRFKSKMPKPELSNNKNGCGYNSEDISSTSRKPKFLRRYLNRKEGKDIPFVLKFNVQSMLSLYDPLPEQFDLRFEFDFSNSNFPDDFGTEKSSSGLGLFEIESLKIKVKYTVGLSVESDLTKFDQQPQTVLDLQFKDLIFDMKNSLYDKSTQKGTLKIPQEEFLKQLDLNLPLKDLIKQPIVTSCDVFDTVQNFTSLHFIWTVKDTDNSVKLTFKTTSTFSAEPEYESVPPYLEQTPAYDAIKADDPV